MRGVFIPLTVLLAANFQFAQADEFLAPEKAFALTAKIVNGKDVLLHWNIARGYHLYRDRLSVQSDDPDVKWGSLKMPRGKSEFDANFNKVEVVYREALELPLTDVQGKLNPLIKVGWQGCSDDGLCYPPDMVQLSVSLKSLGASKDEVVIQTPKDDQSLSASAPTETALSNAAESPGAGNSLDSIATALASGSLLRTISVFWLAGLLLAFTPCVLPMIPILSSLIAGQSGQVSRAKGLGLALAYSLGMALVYAGFGVAAGLAGEGLAAALQNPWVLGAFAVLLATLAMSMFGFYELQMPSAIQSRAAEWSNSFQGGSFVGVFVMGGISALVVGPCVAAPLAGAMVYISQTRDVLLGGLALFAMALGMSVPLLVVGASAGSLLPRAGAWMERVKQVFGMMLLGVAIWMVSPVIPASLHMLLWSAWLLTAATFLGLFGPKSPLHSPGPVAARAGGAGLVCVALVLLIGAASGGKSVLQPLGHLRPNSLEPSTAGATPSGLQFERVASTRALDAALEQAHKAGQPVMLDFYADWCVACKEFEAFTFSNKDVQHRLKKVRLLQADVTANSSEDKALLKRFSLFGPPGVVFFDPGTPGRVIHKVVGYQAADEFLASLTGASIH